MAVEQIRSFFQQALVDLGGWWKAEAQFPEAEESLLIRPHEITKVTNYMLEKANYYSHVGNSIQSALLSSLAISKTYGCMKPKPRFVSRKKGRGRSLKRWIEKIENKTWEMNFDVVRAENYYPDPSGAGLYEIVGHVRFDVNATNQRTISIRLNGSTMIAQQSANALAGGLNAALTVVTQYELAANDYVELLAYQNSGGNLNVTVLGNQSPEFMMTRIG